jgi:hypothetical protein
LPDALVSTRAAEVQDLSLAGEVISGRFRDRRHGWELPIPEGWVARPGPADGLMRVAMERVASDVRVEIWVFPGGGDLTARHREGCFWSYQDVGHFTALEGGGDVHTATCIPDDPAGHRIFATITRREGQILQVEVHAPPDRLVAAKEIGDALTRGLIW